MAYNTKSVDIYMDKFGDIQLNRSDILLTNTMRELIKVNATHRIRSCLGDMKQYKTYGAGLDEFMGQKVSEELCEQMKARIRRALIEDGFLDDATLYIDYIIDDNTVLLKVLVGDFDKRVYNESYEVSISFDTVSGDINVY